MNNDDPYQSWLEKSRNIEVSPDFSREVMARISGYEHERGEGTTRKPDLLHGWLEWISLHPVFQTVLIVAGFLFGVVRLVISLQIILSF
jgi:hypothetical protein